MPKPEDEASNFENLDDLLDLKNDADPSAPKPPSASDIATAALSSLPDLNDPTADAMAGVPDGFGADAFGADAAPDVTAISADEEPGEGDRATTDSPAPDDLGADTAEEGAAPQAEGESADSPAEEAEEKEKKPTLVEKLSKIDPYLVMLIVAFFAILIACLVLFSELSSYKFITKPQAIKKAISAAPVQPGPATTTAVA